MGKGSVLSREEVVYIDDSSLILQSMQEGVKALLESLSHNEKTILSLKHGINSNSAYTCSEIADIWEMPSVKIRQIENRALKKLRKLTNEGFYNGLRDLL